MIVAIHQPNFLPNPAFFAKLVASDAFILLDTAQFPTEGWVHRNRLRVGNDAGWVTVPTITKGRSEQPICDVEYRLNHPWRKKLLKRIQHEYSWSPWKDEVLAALTPILTNEDTGKLVELNLALLKWHMQVLGLAERELPLADMQDRATDTKPAEDPSERLVQLTLRAGGSCYLSGPSGRRYLNSSTFRAAGIELRFAAFRLGDYSDGVRPMIPGLAMLDAILSVGPDAARSLLNDLTMEQENDGAN